MNTRTWILSFLAVGMMVGTGLFLVHQQRHQRLGTPGVEVVPQLVYDPDGAIAGTNSVPLPEVVLDCTSEIVPISREVLDWLPLDTTYAQRIYRATNGFEMVVNVVLMGADRTSIHKPEYCLTGSGWENQEKELTHVIVERPHRYQLPLMKITASNQRTLPSGQVLKVRGIYAFWFVADGELTATHGERMWWIARDLLKDGILQRWAYVSAFSICHPGQEKETFERMKELIAAMVPEFQTTAGSPLVFSGSQGETSDWANLVFPPIASGLEAGSVGALPKIGEGIIGNMIPL